MKSVNFSQDTIALQWRYLKRNLKEIGILNQLGDFEKRAHKKIQDLIQTSIYEDFRRQIGADIYERTDLRLDTRKGEYQRYFTTTFGTSEIKIPRIRNNKTRIRYRLFDRYQRRQKKFDEMVILSMMLGLSTRKQRKFFKAFIGDSVSHTTASNLIMNLEEGLKEFRTKEIGDKYKYLIIDGIWVHIKEHAVCKRPVLFAIGITFENKKELLGFKLSKGETEAEVTAFLNDLYRRGLKGKNLKIVASDGSKGIKAAINMVYPYTRWQLCSTHKLRNLSKNIRNKTSNRKEMMSEASKIYKVSTRKEALERFKKYCIKWEEVESKAIRCFKKDFYDTLTYYDYIEDRNFISTTNHLERYLEEIRRRIKIQGYFKSERSLNLWVFGIVSNFQEEQPKKDMPDYTFQLIEQPKYESAQLS